MSRRCVIVFMSVVSLATAQENANSKADGKSPEPKSVLAATIAGMVESEGPLLYLTFREPPREDGSSEMLSLVKVEKDGMFQLHGDLPQRFIISTVPPCVPIKTLVAGGTSLVANGSYTAKTGFNSVMTPEGRNVSLFAQNKIETGRLLSPFIKGLDSTLGGINLGCPASTRPSEPKKVLPPSQGDHKEDPK